MGCPFGEFSLHLFHSGEFGVAAWVARVAWASDKGVLPSTPLFRFFRTSTFFFFLQLMGGSVEEATVWVSEVAWAARLGSSPSTSSIQVSLGWPRGSRGSHGRPIKASSPQPLRFGSTAKTLPSFFFTGFCFTQGVSVEPAELPSAELGWPPTCAW
jgi:hypothetical protein